MPQLAISTGGSLDGPLAESGQAAIHQSFDVPVRGPRFECGADGCSFRMLRSLALISANGSYRRDQTFAGTNADGQLWSARAPQQIPRILFGKRSADGQCGHRRTIMEMPETELTATRRPV